jgi:hypothetical protein
MTIYPTSIKSGIIILKGSRYILLLKDWEDLFIGDNIHHFKPGGMILLGANLPNLW